MVTYCSDRIREYAARLGINQSQLATQTGIDRGVINRLWNGRQVDTQLTTLHRIAAVLGVKTPMLVCDRWTDETNMMEDEDGQQL